MNPMLLGPLLDLGGKLIDRMVPDPQAKAAAELELLKLTQSGELQTIVKQLEINAKEAMHPSLLVAGGRPFVIWVCGVGFAYSTLLHPLLSWLSLAKGWPLPPEVNADVLMYALGGLLGLGGFRSIEKVKGAAR